MQMLLEEPVTFQVVDRVGAGDEHREVRPPLGRGTEDAQFHPVGGSVDLFEIRDDLVPADEMKIGSRLESQVRFGRGHRGGMRPTLAAQRSTQPKTNGT